MIKKLGKAEPLIQQERTLEILSLTGGGIRGLFSATVLDQLEKEKRCDIENKFGCFAGTSIGGILAIGLACGIKAGSMRAALRTKAGHIFKRTLFSRLNYKKPVRNPLWR